MWEVLCLLWVCSESQSTTATAREVGEGGGRGFLDTSLEFVPVWVNERNQARLGLLSSLQRSRLPSPCNILLRKSFH